jgi:hypothetical protein
MQRPPSMSWTHANSFANSPSMDSDTTQLRHHIMALTDRSPTACSSANKQYSMASLAALSIHLWPVVYPSPSRYTSPGIAIKNHSLWKADFVELACDTWLRTAGAGVNPSSLAVYHMMNIMLHANLAGLQYFAHSRPGSEARDPEKSSTGREIHAWIQDKHYVIARWHAENLTNAIENAFDATSDKANMQDSRLPLSVSSSTSTELARLPFETPHVPYAIYFATLILWCGSLVRDNSCSSDASARAHLARGERILSLHKVHIARLLACVLQEVK